MIGIATPKIFQNDLTLYMDRLDLNLSQLNTQVLLDLNKIKIEPTALIKYTRLKLVNNNMIRLITLTINLRMTKDIYKENTTVIRNQKETMPMKTVDQKITST
jgi:hypothetical protein